MKISTMNKLTGKEILQILNENYSTSSIAYGELGEFQNQLTEQEQQEIIDQLGEVKQVYSRGGEGKGDEWSRVQHFVDHDVYIRVDAYYASYEGTDFDGASVYVCKPIEKTVVFYE